MVFNALPGKVLVILNAILTTGRLTDNDIFPGHCMLVTTRNVYCPLVQSFSVFPIVCPSLEYS